MTDTHDDPAEILRELADLYERKNEAYGDSWRVCGDILYLMAGGPTEISLDSPEDWMRLGLYTRRVDKLCRAFNGEFGDIDAMDFEAIRDSHEDEAVYGVMAGTLADDIDTVLDDE